jgi:CheY-like chemotaxis protein/anti-sigma regulatory factor (Ser/Thr protein kinase)
LDIRDIDPIPPVDAAIAAQRPVAEAKRVHLRTSMETNAAHIRVDSDRLQQIVSNLVDNSIKFTEADGDVEVGLKSEGTHLKITIRDSGIGIKRDFLPFVFDRFRQADPKITRSRAGRGLGLAIVRQLVERMGGEVHADSDGEGKGATFVVRFPLRGMNDGNITVCREKESAHHPTLLDGLRILVVDDNTDTCFMLKTMIEDCGATATTVTSAAEAMEAIGHGDFDLLVSDIAMPNVDGYRLIESVRGLPSRAGRIPAIALTAYGRAEDRAKALRAGYQTFMVKPVAYDELMAVIADLV